MKIVDRIFAWILVLGAIGHGIGSYLGYRNEPVTMLWAFNASFAGLLVAAVNLLRAGRPADRPVAWVALLGSLTLAASAITFGVLIHNVFDPRPLVHASAALALAAFSLKALLSDSQDVSSV